LRDRFDAPPILTALTFGRQLIDYIFNTTGLFDDLLEAVATALTGSKRLEPWNAGGTYALPAQELPGSNAPCPSQAELPSASRR